MNWTGGRLHTYQKGGGSALVKKQKEHFAKARAKAQNGTRTRSVRSVFPAEDDRHVERATISSPQGQTRLEDYQNVAPVVGRLSRMSDLKHSKQNHGTNEGSRSALRQTSINLRRRHEPGKSNAPDTRDNEVPATAINAKPSDREIEAQRAKLLLQNDWLGLRPSKPIQYDFTKNQEREHLAKRRKITTRDRERREAPGQRLRVPSIREDYHMAGGLNERPPERMKIRIGDDALVSRLSSLTPTQQTLGSARPRTKSSSSMLLDAESVPSQEAQVMHGDVADNGGSDEFILLEDGQTLFDHLGVDGSAVTSDLPSSHLRLKGAQNSRHSSILAADGISSPIAETSQKSLKRAEVDPTLDKPNPSPDQGGDRPAPTPATSQANSHVAVLGSPPKPQRSLRPAQRPSKSVQSPGAPLKDPPNKIAAALIPESPKTLQPDDSASLLAAKIPQPSPNLQSGGKSRLIPYSSSSDSTPTASPSRSHMEVLNLAYGPSYANANVTHPIVKAPAVGKALEAPSLWRSNTEPTNNSIPAPIPVPDVEAAAAQDDDDEVLWRAFVFGSPSHSTSPSLSQTISKTKSFNPLNHDTASYGSSLLTTSSPVSARATAHTSTSPGAAVVSSVSGVEGSVVYSSSSPSTPSHRAADGKPLIPSATTVAQSTVAVAGLGSTSSSPFRKFSSTAASSSTKSGNVTRAGASSPAVRRVRDRNRPANVFIHPRTKPRPNPKPDPSRDPNPKPTPAPIPVSKTRSTVAEAGSDDVLSSNGRSTTASVEKGGTWVRQDRVQNQNWIQNQVQNQCRDGKKEQTWKKKDVYEVPSSSSSPDPLAMSSGP